MKKIILNTLSIVLAVSIVTLVTYTSIADSITETKIKESIKENLLTGFIYDDNGNKTEIFNTILRLTKLDEETVIKFMENKTADKIITDVVNSIYDYNLTGDPSYKYTSNKIISLVEDNMDKILSEINYTITKEERQEVLDYTYNNTTYIINTIYSTNIGDYTKW